VQQLRRRHGVSSRGSTRRGLRWQRAGIRQRAAHPPAERGQILPHLRRYGDVLPHDPAGPRLEQAGARLAEQASALVVGQAHQQVLLLDAAGLTRGGFYAHFRSKVDLMAAVTAEESDFVDRLRAARADAAGRSAGVRAVIEGYLDPANRGRVGAGCTLAALTGDVARAPRRVRAAYGDLVRRLAAELLEHVPPELPDRRARALAAVALCFGGIAIARAVADERLANEVVAACRERAVAEVTGTSAD
jgi:TetR/AcrR family transcriptional repressor of nem operon